MKKRLIYFMICLLGSGITAQAQYTYTLKTVPGRGTGKQLFTPHHPQRGADK